MSEQRATINGLPLEGLELTVSHRVDPIYHAGFSRPMKTLGVQMEATVRVDQATYERLDQAALFTVEHTTDLNPWHRKAESRGERLRRLRDGLWWSFRKRILRRHLIDTVRVTVPDCRVVGVCSMLDEAT